jgi:ATP phosphoribosyltransferase
MANGYMQITQQDIPRIVLPGKGTLAPLIQSFLERKSMRYTRVNNRQYTGTLQEYRNVEISFQRATDIPYLIHQGYAAIGITGYDVVAEYQIETQIRSEPLSSLVVLRSEMGVAPCSIQMSVPATWDTINTIADIAKLAETYPMLYERPLRVATHYPGITRQYLQAQGVAPYTLVPKLQGSYESAPYLGLSDIIVDFVVSGSTVYANNLKFLDDGILLRSQACLLGNRELLHEHEKVLEPILAQLGMPVASAV